LIGEFIDFSLDSDRFHFRFWWLFKDDFWLLACLWDVALDLVGEVLEGVFEIHAVFDQI
jgi:hypothetical protein